MWLCDGDPVKIKMVEQDGLLTYWASLNRRIQEARRLAKEAIRKGGAKK